jgi:hypothetical protein
MRSSVIGQQKSPPPDPAKGLCEERVPRRS